MAFNRQNLSRFDEYEEQPSVNENKEIISYHEQPPQQEDGEDEEPDPFNELGEFTSSAKTDANKFRMLCDHVQNSFAEIDNSMFELLELKDNLLLQFLPANVSSRITLVISRLYRAYSLSQIPLHELVRLVQLYSQPFDMKSVVIKNFYANNEMKNRMLNAALQRLSSMESISKRHQQLRCITNWEKMYIRLALPRSNVRKWKFRLKKFRETAQLGYEHVIEWLNSTVPRATSETEVLSKEDPLDEEDELDDLDQVESSGDQVSVRDVDDQHQGSDYGDEIESDNDGSFLSSAGKQRRKRTAGSGKVEEPVEEAVMTKTDVEIQATPDVDNQQTSTGDVLSTKALIIRVYRPVGISKTKFQCMIHTQGQDYTTNIFAADKPETPKPEGRGTTHRTSKKSMDTQHKKHRGGSAAVQEDNDANTADKQQCEELIIPMPTVLKRRSLLDTGIDPEAIHIEVLGDDKLSGSVLLSSEDLRMLDLPNLHSPSVAPLVTIDDSTANVTESVSKNSQLEFEELSYDLYKSWISRTPQTFTVYNDKHEPMGKLPLHMFWYNKVEITHATKCTMTASFQRRIPTAKMTSVPRTPPSMETHEKTISLVVTPPTADMEENAEPIPSDFTNTDEHIEDLKATYEEKIAQLHETYEAQIHRLKKYIHETLARGSNQTDEVPELDENIREILGEEMIDMNTQQQVRPPSKREVNVEHHPTPTYGKNISNSFLDRYQMYLDRSAAHRQQLMTKIEQETARTVERQMEIQHRLHKPDQHGERYDDLCLPAVFMPFRSGNVFNPRAYRFFHHAGTSDPRLTQTPSIFKLPPLPSGSVSVLNLFELSRCYDAPNEQSQPVDQITNQVAEPSRPVTSPTTRHVN